MSTELKIDREFAGMCPELTAEEMDLLEASLTADGCREPIIVWANHDDTILDGHNRYSICRRFNVPFKTKALKIETREECVNWIVSNQLGRRNLTDSQKSYLRGKRYQAEEKGHGGDRRSEESSGHFDHLKTEDRLADEYDVAPKTIRRDAAFSRAVDKIADTIGPEVKADILAGRCKLGKAAIIEAADLPPKKMSKAIERGELPTQNQVISDAMRFAGAAIAQLERIKDDDPERRAALDKVSKWIKDRRT